MNPWLIGPAQELPTIYLDFFGRTAILPMACRTLPTTKQKPLTAKLTSGAWVPPLSILASEPNAPLGSLREMSKSLGVGIVTIQQAARVLEHEGLLKVRRGPGGGYYGTRPDEAALGRLISGFPESAHT